MPRRRGEYDDPDWKEVGSHLGEAFSGTISELRSDNPSGKPFKPVRGPMGFCIDPSAYRRKRRRKVDPAK
jgi:hypothetical protein